MDVTPGERHRMVDMSSRFAPKLALAYGVCGIVLFSAAPTYGWWVVALILADALKTAIATSASPLSAVPEAWLFGDFVTTVLVMAAGVWFTGGVESPFLPWFAMLAALLPALFSRRLLRFGAVALLVATLVGALGPDHEATPSPAVRFGAIAGMILAVGLASHEMMRSDTRHRSHAVVDPLTGLPNRRAFELRLDELARSGEQTAFIVADIDHFKRVNDQHGHDRGDEVLVAVAAELRQSLRASDLPYRVGGEEFVFVLPRTEAEDAARLAELLRARFEVAEPAGLDITVSFGVSAAAAASSLVDAYRDADQALLRAKRGGRNRVEITA